MCCAVIYPAMPMKLEFNDIEEMYKPTKLMYKKANRSIDRVPKQIDNSTTNMSGCCRPKQTTTVAENIPKHNASLPGDKEDAEAKSKAKKKKWKAVPLGDLGFTMSLFPRPTRPEKIDPEAEEELWRKIETDLDDYDKTVEKYKDFDIHHDELFEGRVTKSDKHKRRDRHQRVRKAGKAIKDKHCIDLNNNKGRKKLYVHHRLYMKITMATDFTRRGHYLPSRRSCNKHTNTFNKETTETKSRLKPNRWPPLTPKPAPTQNLRFALESHNASHDIETDLISLLITLQHRDLTPEDYETLLRLDDSVAPKTVDKGVLDNLETVAVTEAIVGDMCAVCMEQYELGQTIKHLPCAHVFHANCIDMWLENSSRNCPIDGLPIDDHS